jgi:ABC-2 type transport system ATP-binding protein
MGRVRGFPARAIRARTGELAARLGFEPVLGERMAALSKGTVQKVVLAQALLGTPALLVLDEPWTGLDSVAQRRLADLLAELRSSGACVVLTDHHEVAVDAVADRICRLESGRAACCSACCSPSRPTTCAASTSARPA